MKSIGFIGLGTMGLPMARNLLRQGYNVSVYNRNIEKANALTARGAKTAVSPADLAGSVDVLITMVSDDQAIKAIYYDADGIMEGLRAGTAIIDCSTISPSLSRQLYHDLQSHGVDFLDAPVTGSKPAAEQAALTFMVGGALPVFNKHQDVFKAMGRKLLYMGPSGSGSEAKLAHNAIVGINVAALAEGVALAAKAGIDPEAFLELVQSGGAASKMSEMKGPKILNRDFSVQFSLELMLKDLTLASRMSDQLGVPMPSLNTAKTLYQIADQKGLGPHDLSSVLLAYEDWMNQEVRITTAKDETNLTTDDRRRSIRVPMHIKLQLSVHQWEQEGAFTGQHIEGELYDLSDSGLQISSAFPLAQDMFVVIHFPNEADLPPITGKIIRVETDQDRFRYGCMISGLPPHTRLKLEAYITSKLQEQQANLM